MKIICFPQAYYRSEVSRLVEIGLGLRALGQEVGRIYPMAYLQWHRRNCHDRN